MNTADFNVNDDTTQLTIIRTGNRLIETESLLKTLHREIDKLKFERTSLLRRISDLESTNRSLSEVIVEITQEKVKLSKSLHEMENKMRDYKSAMRYEILNEEMIVVNSEYDHGSYTNENIVRQSSASHSEANYHGSSMSFKSTYDEGHHTNEQYLNGFKVCNELLERARESDESSDPEPTNQSTQKSRKTKPGSFHFTNKKKSSIIANDSSEIRRSKRLGKPKIYEDMEITPKKMKTVVVEIQNIASSVSINQGHNSTTTQSETLTNVEPSTSKGRSITKNTPKKKDSTLTKSWNHENKDQPQEVSVNENEIDKQNFKSVLPKIKLVKVKSKSAWAHGKLKSRKQHSKKPAISGNSNNINRSRNSNKSDSTEKYDCETCGKILKNKQSLDIHVRLHTGEKPFSCACGENFRQHPTLRKHQKTSCTLIKTKENDENTVKEEESGDVSHPENLLHHLNLHRTKEIPKTDGERKYACSICKKSFTHIWILERHGRKMHGPSLVPSLNHHQRSHTFKKPATLAKKRTLKAKNIPCTICNKILGNEYLYVQHMRMHTGEKPFSCNVCQRTFSGLSHLNKHKQIHTNKNGADNEANEKKPTLKVFIKRCNKTNDDGEAQVNDEVNIEQHENTHSCTSCEKSFSSLKKLDHHMKTEHANRKPYECSTCGKSFSFRCRWRNHEETHREINKFACSICKTMFSTEQGMKKHVASAHVDGKNEIKTYTCDECGKICVTRAGLRKHRNTHTRASNKVFADIVESEEMPSSSIGNDNLSSVLTEEPVGPNEKRNEGATSRMKDNTVSFPVADASSSESRNLIDDEEFPLVEETLNTNDSSIEAAPLVNEIESGKISLYDVEKNI